MNATREPWTLTSWVEGDDADGYVVHFPSQESAANSGRSVQAHGDVCDACPKPRAWSVCNPDGDEVEGWTADGVCPECKVGDVENIYYEADTGHQQAGCSEGCGWAT